MGEEGKTFEEVVLDIFNKQITTDTMLYEGQNELREMVKLLNKKIDHIIISSGWLMEEDSK